MPPRPRPRTRPPPEPVTSESARAFVALFADRPVLIVGDVMLDHFVVGRVTRISPEAPVPVVAFERDEHRLGGAANVAHNVRALGGRVAVVGTVGRDAGAERLAGALTGAGVDASGLVTDPARPTTTKMRVVTERNQQVSRIDYESDREAPPDVERLLVARVEERIGNAAAVVVSDYLKGTVTRTVAARTIEMARARGVPVIVDPKVPHVDYYRGALLVTPNHHEAEAVTLRRLRATDDVRAAARAFRERAGSAAVLVTRGEHGMWLLDDHDGEHDLPAAAREVSDVTGAGDTVVAAVALGLAAGASLVEAATLANHAAGLVVAHFGPATVTPQELLASF